MAHNLEHKAAPYKVYGTIIEIRSKTVFNIGKSAIVGGKHIAKIADECKAINKL